MSSLYLSALCGVFGRRGAVMLGGWIAMETSFAAFVWYRLIALRLGRLAEFREH